MAHKRNERGTTKHLIQIIVGTQNTECSRATHLGLHSFFCDIKVSVRLGVDQRLSTNVLNRSDVDFRMSPNFPDTLANYMKRSRNELFGNNCSNCDNKSHGEHNSIPICKVLCWECDLWQIVIAAYFWPQLVLQWTSVFMAIFLSVEWRIMDRFLLPLHLFCFFTLGKVPSIVGPKF